MVCFIDYQYLRLMFTKKKIKKIKKLYECYAARSQYANEFASRKF